jgi:hypothetical protein
MSKLTCGRVHFGPHETTRASVICKCCGRPMTRKERIEYVRLRFKVFEIMMVAQFSLSRDKVQR